MKTPPLRCAAFLALLASLEVSAAPAERIRESETKQEAIRGDARRIVEQLDAMLDEYQRNGLAGEDTATVRGVRASIEHLTAEEMKQVVALLEKARGMGDEGAAKKTVAEAFAAQKAILTQMQQLLDRHRRNQQALELAQTLTQLADRQETNLKNGIALGQWVGGKKPEQFEAAMQANLDGQMGEQGAIAAELRMAVEKLAAFAKETPDAEAAARFNKALEAAQKVQPGVDAAAEALGQAQLFKAAAEEKAARDALRRIAREVAPPEDKATALRNAERELDKLVEQQREIVADVRKQAANELPALEAPQADVAFRSDALAQDLQKNAGAAAQALNAAQEKMQDARAGMAEQKGDAALRGGQEALAHLEAAQAQLAQEAARTEALAGKPGDAARDLQALVQQVEQLAQQQAAAARKPDKSAQPALAQQASQLAQRAEAMSPQAAPAMQQAAANAQQAAQPGQQPAQTSAAQQAAAQNLQQAAQQLAQQAAAAQQNPAPMDANATQTAQAQLGEAAAQLAQAQANLDTAQAAQAAQRQAQQAGQPNAANASAQQAADAMQQASQQAAEAAKQAAAAAQGAAANGPAQAAAQQAAQAATQAAAQAAGNQPSAAQAVAGQAQAALAQARAALAQAQAGITPSAGASLPGPGKQPGPPGSKPGNQPGKPGGSTAAEKYAPGAADPVQLATRAERLKKANFTGLPPRERAAIEQSQGEKYPEEYGSQVEQYLLNLARESAGR